MQDTVTRHQELAVSGCEMLSMQNGIAQGKKHRACHASCSFITVGPGWFVLASAAAFAWAVLVKGSPVPLSSIAHADAGQTPGQTRLEAQW